MQIPISLAHFSCQSLTSNYSSSSVLHRFLLAQWLLSPWREKVELNGRSASLTLQLPQEETELKIYRPKSDASMEDIEAGKTQALPSRQPIDKKKLSYAMNNVQRILLKGGAERDWTPRAQTRLKSLVAKPIAFKNMKLPIRDQQPDANEDLEDGNPQIPIHLPARLKKMPLWRVPLTQPTRTSRSQSCKGTLSQSSLPCMRLRKICSAPKRN